VVIRGSSQRSKLPGREADHFTCGAVFKCRLARYLTKSKLSIFLFFWWGDTVSLCLRPLTDNLSTHNSTQTALGTNTVCYGQKQALYQSRAVYCLCVCFSSVFYCSRICICLRDLYCRETEHAESYSYWPRTRRALGVAVTDTIPDENCHNWSTFCLDWHVFATTARFIQTTTAAKLFSVCTYARHQNRRGRERIASPIISLSTRCGWVGRYLCRLSLGAGVDGFERRLM